MQGLENVQVVDGEAVVSPPDPASSDGWRACLDDGATQPFDVGWETRYVEADGRPTQGK